MLSSAKLVALTLGLATSVLVAGNARAQTQPVPPENYTLDARGVDQVSGSFNYGVSEVVIGQPGAGGIAHGRVHVSGGWRDTLLGTINVSGSTYVVSVGGESEVFILSGGVFTPQSNSGATLTQAGNGYTFTSASGAVGQFFNYYANVVTPYEANAATLDTYTAPNGEVLRYNYFGTSYCAFYDLDGNCQQEGAAARLQSVTNTHGYQIKYTYASDDPNNTLFDWLTVGSVTGFNMAEDYCDPFAPTCPNFTRPWPSVTYDARTPATVTDELGRTTTYSYSGNGLTGVRLPGQSGNQATISYHGDGRVSGVTDATGAWTYTYSDAGNQRTTVASQSDTQQQITTVADLTIQRATSVTEALTATTSRTINYAYDGQRRLQRITQPEGDYAELSYDGRGNVSLTTFVDKSGPGPSNITIGATYPGTCTNTKTCNQPIATTDARGAVTEYTYHPDHGGVLTVTEPAPTLGADRPQTRITYGSQFAWYKNQIGVISQAPTPITLPVAVSACATGTSCAGSANEVTSTVTYGTTGVANNLLPTSTTSGSGDGVLAVTTTTAYDANGDVLTVDGPLPGADDTTRYRYDAGRQLVGVVGPDPDGAGPLLNRALRMTYNPDGSVQQSEIGTTAGQGDPAWTNFTSLQQGVNVYDGFIRAVASRFNAGGTTYGLQQVSYDAAGRPDCTAQRMNPNVFASPPSACTASAVAGFGPDRITRTIYDRASQVMAVTSGLGTAAELTETASYTLNGRVETLTDGQSNTSTFVYDGFDRLSRLRYPNSTGGVSSTTDYEEYTYDPAGNILTARTRADATFSAAYDALNRTTLIDAPTGTDDIGYGYDNLGRPITATIPSQTTTMAWDALSRPTSQTGALGTMAMQYDAAGRRTRLAWPDGWHVTYDYDLTNSMTAVRQSGATLGIGVLALYAYDNLGRRSSVMRGNGVGTVYGYDPASRLTSLSHDLAGTGSDQTWGYQHNPVGQILALSSSNPAYAYTPVAGNTGYQINGLNQVTAVNATSLTYDANGNLTNDGTRGFTYDSANRLRSTNAGASTISYDAFGRLDQYVGTSGGRYLYDGIEASAVAVSGNTIATRFVRGPWPDEIVASFGGTSTTPTSFWLQDHLGSTIAHANTIGDASLINAYDEYGIPKPSNGARFQYTGQLWLPDFGVYHYKARAYHPGLGRFLQTDPIGYAAGANLYGYVAGDPVNSTDPLGLCFRITTTRETGEGPGGLGVATSSRLSGCFAAPSGGILGFPGSRSPDGGGRGSGRGVPPVSCVAPESRLGDRPLPNVEDALDVITVATSVQAVNLRNLGQVRAAVGGLSGLGTFAQLYGEGVRVLGDVSNGVDIAVASSAAAGRLGTRIGISTIAAARFGAIGFRARGPAGAIIGGAVGALSGALAVEAGQLDEVFGDLIADGLLNAAGCE